MKHTETGERRRSADPERNTVKMTISNPLAVKRDALLAITLDDQNLTNAMEILSSNYPQVDLASDSEQLLRILEREREQSHASFLEAYDRFIEVIHFSF